jgi:hypothetical protein
VPRPLADARGSDRLVLPYRQWKFALGLRNSDETCFRRFRRFLTLVWTTCAAVIATGMLPHFNNQRTTVQSRDVLALLSSFIGCLVGFWGLWNLAAWSVPNPRARLPVALVAFLFGSALWMIGIRGLALWSIRDMR